MAEEQKKYVVYGMRAKCSEGSMENYISTDVGHGVVYQGQPLLNANDHTPQVNLTHFGDCHSKLIYEEAKKQADEKYKADADDGFFAKAGKFIAKNVTKAALTAKEYLGANKCELDTPLPWMFGNSEHMIDGAPALTMESQCACRFGGIISIVPEEEEVAESIEEETAEAAEGAAGDAEGISAVNIAPVLAKGVLLTKAAENSTEEGMDGPWAGVTDAIGKALSDAAMAAKRQIEDAKAEEVEETSKEYIGRYPKAYIDGIIKAYETHKIEDGRFVLTNNGKTIAYGHDVRKGEDFSNGLSMQEGLDLAIKDLDEKYEIVKNKVEQLNSEDFGYDIDIDSFTENEIIFLVDFVYNRGEGLADPNPDHEPGKLNTSLAVLIVAITEDDDQKIIDTLMSEVYNKKGEYLEGLEKRRMDEYEILKFGDYERDDDMERDYTKPKE